MIFGYARVSTQDQNLDSQIDELKLLGAEKIFLEKVSGKSLDRTELQKMFEQLRENDLVLVVRLDRLARSLKDLVFLIDEFAQRKVILQIGNLK